MTGTSLSCIRLTITSPLDGLWTACKSHENGQLVKTLMERRLLHQAVAKDLTSFDW